MSVSFIRRIVLSVTATGLFAALPAQAQNVLKPWTQGGFETHRYRNVFAEMGYPQQEIDARLEAIFQEVFYGPDKVYFQVGDDMGYMSDVKNFDARTEGMSYGMMIAVQLDKKDEFDRLFRWAKKYMQYQDGPMKGYFAWSLSPDGTIRGRGPASDGELYFITSLIFASNRWGNDGEINYLAEAKDILDSSWEKDGSEGIMPFINKENHLIVFTPDGRGIGYTDPSYHLPAFYEVWARWADDGRADFYRACASASREYLHKSINPETGLNPDTNNFDGTVIEMPAFFGRRSKPAFRFDSWRVPMNIALDYSWACADREWQTNYANTIQNFFYSKGIDSFADQYNVDGTEVDFAMPAGQGEFRGTGTRHSVGLVATLAAATLAADHPKAREFAQRLWDSKNEPYEDGYFDAYYDGILRLFAFMHLSGHYRVIEPAKPSYRVRVDQPQHGKVTVFPAIPESGLVPEGTVLHVKADVTDPGWVFDSGYELSITGGMFYPTYKESMVPEFDVKVDHNIMSIGASIIEAERLQGYRTIQDVVYAQPGVKPLKYDVFIPDGAKKLPCVIIIHGGGWASNTEDIMRGLARELIKDGKYVVCSIDYRWLNKADGDAEPNRMHQLIEDCYGAILHIQEHAAEYGIDPKKLAVTGDSAGGHLSACMIDLVERVGDGGFGVKPGVYQFLPTYLPKGMTAAKARKSLRAIQAAAPSYGVFDLNTLARFADAYEPMGLVAITPDCNIPSVKARKVPQYLVLGTLDRTVGRAPMEKYVQHLKDAGQKAELVIVDGASHAFFDWKPDQRTKDTFAKYGVPYAADMKRFFDEVFYK